jgi:hypothetical protein
MKDVPEEKKPYATPELTTHGTVEQITGFFLELAVSGISTDDCSICNN